MLFEKSSGLLVGCSGFHDIDWRIPAMEIGYWVRTGQVGKGFVTEAVNRLTELAFTSLNAKRVEIRCDRINERSRKVAERCGFQLEGTLLNEDMSPDGELRDTCIYGKTR